MRRVFQDNVARAVGFTTSQLKRDEFQLIGNREPTDIKTLISGNISYEYDGYWTQYHIDRSPCTVYIEVEPESELVVDAYSQGDGCYMPF
jgi:hypothetical protein